MHAVCHARSTAKEFFFSWSLVVTWNYAIWFLNLLHSWVELRRRRRRRKINALAHIFTIILLYARSVVCILFSFALFSFFLFGNFFNERPTKRENKIRPRNDFCSACKIVKIIWYDTMVDGDKWVCVNVCVPVLYIVIIYFARQQLVALRGSLQWYDAMYSIN